MYAKLRFNLQKKKSKFVRKLGKHALTWSVHHIKGTLYGGFTVYTHTLIGSSKTMAYIKQNLNITYYEYN